MNLFEVGFRRGPQNFIQCYPIIFFWFNSLISPMNLSEVSEQFFSKPGYWRVARCSRFLQQRNLNSSNRETQEILLY